MSSLLKLVHLDQPWLYASVATILFNPIFWNFVARNGKSTENIIVVVGGAFRLFSHHCERTEADSA